MRQPFHNRRFALTLALDPQVSGSRPRRVISEAAHFSRQDLRRLGDGQGVQQVNAVSDEVLDVIAG